MSLLKHFHRRPYESISIHQDEASIACRHRVYTNSTLFWGAPFASLAMIITAIRGPKGELICFPVDVVVKEKLNVQCISIDVYVPANRQVHSNISYRDFKTYLF